MYYKIIEKKSVIDSNNEIKQNECLDSLLKSQSELIDNFMEVNDNQVKIIHYNQEDIKKDLDVLFRHSESICKISKDATKLYDEFIEYMKEAGDLYNFAQILADDMNKLHDKIKESN